ncbi:MAG: hypothetical protein PHP98_00970 [Kiritimatiellae bacterium]|nr:hypothetical protein [Kiritimatiellia bacterium]
MNTARDIMRQPVIIILLTVCIATIGMLPVIAVFTLGQEERIVRDGALASCFLYGLFLVVASSIASLSRQVRDGTAGMVLAKPVSRELFFAATYCGIALVCFLFTAAGGMAALLAVRMALAGIHTDWLVGGMLAAAFLLAFAAAGAANYRGYNFCSALFKTLLLCLLAALIIASFFGLDGQLVAFGTLMRWRLVPSAFLVFGALAALSAIALAFSARLVPAVVFFCCCLVFILGMISEYLLVNLAGGGPLAGICAAALPDWQCFWVDEAFEKSGALGPGYFLRAGGYAVLYISGALTLGMLLFRNADA